MRKKDMVEVSKKQMPAISFLLGLAVLATTAAYIIYRYTSDKAYRKKWQEYDECGLA